MQPYFLPYIGYWQLIAAVDQFVVLDDVHFINRGWINRNRIVVNNSPAWLTLPLKKASQNKLIHEIEIQDDDGWRKRMEKTLACSYSKASEFFALSNFMAESIQKAQGNLSSYLSDTISRICEMLQIQTQITPTSRNFPKGDLRGQERILDICKQLSATVYINPPGGRALYQAEMFEAQGIQLRFLEAPSKTNLSSGLGNAEQLSILDTLMHNSQEDIRRVIADFKISI
jgi:hypothetical protein